MRICDAAVAVLKETGNPAVMWGDSYLLHTIAERAGARCAHRGGRTERAVLEALTRQPGELKAGFTLAAHNRLVRIFRLPEARAAAPTNRKAP